ncbi:MAG: hypothetical protein IJD99_12805, partial [Clostridia bacterium]|nr:hypothetical protein [Clostridia bacterium]
CIVFKVQCRPGGVPRESACVSYHHPKEKSTAFFNFFTLFLNLFGFANDFPKPLIARFAFGPDIPKQHRPKTFGILSQHHSHRRNLPHSYLTKRVSYFIIRTSVLCMVEST